MRVVFVHGACVKDGAWWWHRVADLLNEHQVRSVAPGLPSCGEGETPAGTYGPGLSEDVAVVREVLLDGTEPTVVVAHSYGGMIAAEAAAGLATVKHLLLISSYLPEVGQRLSDFGSPGPAPFLDADLDVGRFTVRPELLAETFLQDCAPDIQIEAKRHLAAQSLQVTGQGVRAAAWHQVPSTYLVCTEDRGTPAYLQREYARKSGTLIEIDSGHHPFLSHPAEVRDIILNLQNTPVIT